jgi:hypothetical protein
MQSTNHVFMVRPKRFGYNPQTAQDNTFQSIPGEQTQEEIAIKALAEFDAMVTDMRNKGIDVTVFEENLNAPGITPDVVFPNNWISTHSNGIIILYPMRWENRQWERREDIVALLKSRCQVSQLLDLSSSEKQGQYLEGTGSMIIDHINGTIYAAISERTQKALTNEVGKQLGYQVVTFSPNRYTSATGVEAAIYHTNVMMCIATNLVVVCIDAIVPEDRERVLASLKQSGKEIVEISLTQMLESFCGNMLEVQGPTGLPYLLMSTTAYGALTAKQRETILQHNQILHFPIPTIEKYGGGSVRCMVAENFLPLAH